MWRNFKKIFHFFINYWYLSLFVVIALATLLFAYFKLKQLPSSQIYAKVKIGPYFWWEGERQPSIWYAGSLKKGEAEEDLLGNKVAEIMAVRYYPAIDAESQKIINSQYNIFLTARLVVDDEGEGRYKFNREPVAVGAPIEFEFPSAKVTGTVVEVVKDRKDDLWTERQVTLLKENFSSWEYEAIRVGDNYFDGEEVVFEVSGKRREGKDLLVTARVKVQEKGEELVYGEEYPLKAGAKIPFATVKFVFDDFVITKVK